MADQPVLGLGVRSLLEAGRRLGYEFEVICDHPLNVIRVVRDGAGFLFQTWPGFITLRRRDDYGSLVDKSAQKALGRQGYTLDSVPSAGAVARLSRRVTGRDGADFIDTSDRVHPDTVKLCEAFARRQRLFMAGFDLITPMIEGPLREVGACNEVNVREVDATCIAHCNVGARRPVSRHVWERVPFDRVAAPWCPAW